MIYGAYLVFLDLVFHFFIKKTKKKTPKNPPQHCDDFGSLSLMVAVVVVLVLVPCTINFPTHEKNNDQAH